MIVDFHAQVLHTKAIFSHAFILKEISLIIGLSLEYQKFTLLNSISHFNFLILFESFLSLSNFISQNSFKYVLSDDNCLCADQNLLNINQIG